MDVREQMKQAILKQEQTFRQQVHELHRLYHLQKQLMQQTQPPASSYAPAIIKPKPESFQILHRERPMNPQRVLSFSTTKAPPVGTAPAEDCSLELTLAMGPSSSGGSGDARRRQAKRLRTSSDPDSGTTTVSSTTLAESELARFGDQGDVTKTAVRFQSEATRMDGIGQGAWMYQCLRLKTA